MIVEDDLVIRRELSIVLEKYGYSVVTIEDFSDVVSFIITQSPHLVLLDINLPQFDGFHVCREIRAKSRIPILIVTSRNSDFDELMSMNLGADDYITKPYNTQILLARISAILNRTYNIDTSDILSFGELHLNASKGLLTYGDDSIELTKNEIKILSLLIKNKDRITSRDEIMNELWQSDEFVDDNTLTVNINRLRKKMTEIGADGMLKTKRGQGYSL